MRLQFAIAAATLPLLFGQAPKGPTIPQLDEANPELVKLVAQDQWDRGIDMFAGGKQTPKPMENMDWTEVGKRDHEREDAVRTLLADGKVQTMKDYRFAALIFQHSSDPDGYLLAHVLAVTAVGKGDVQAKWLAAATMDRYLHTMKQPQLFGTQFHQVDGKWTMDPYDKTVFSDAIRATWCVIPIAEQDKVLKDFQDGKPLRGTSLRDCK